MPSQKLLLSIKHNADVNVTTHCCEKLATQYTDAALGRCGGVEYVVG